MSKERSISYSAPMILAKLQGRKTQTRRIIKGAESREGAMYGLDHACGEEFFRKEPLTCHRCPYGHPGDILRVREAFRITAFANHREGRWAAGKYLADNTAFNCILTPDEFAKLQRWKQPYKSKPPMYMFASLSRMRDEIVSVRVERVNDISAADAIAEGMAIDDAVYDYSRLWEKLHGSGSWELNYFVWVLETKPVTP